MGGITGITEARKLLSHDFFQEIFSTGIVVCPPPCSCFPPQAERTSASVVSKPVERENTMPYLVLISQKNSMEDVLVLFSSCLKVLSQSQTLTYKLLKNLTAWKQCTNPMWGLKKGADFNQ